MLDDIMPDCLFLCRKVGDCICQDAKSENDIGQGIESEVPERIYFNACVDQVNQRHKVEHISEAHRYQVYDHFYIDIFEPVPGECRVVKACDEQIDSRNHYHPERIEDIIYSDYQAGKRVSHSKMDICSNSGRAKRLRCVMR